jgi:hypothetical protein
LLRSTGSRLEKLCLVRAKKVAGPGRTVKVKREDTYNMIAKASRAG